MTNFKNKKIAILGWGVDTEDIVPYLLGQSALLVVYDRKERLEAGEWLKDRRIVWRLGSEKFDDLTKFDAVVRNPAVYRFRQEIIKAEKAGVEITSKIKVFFDLCPAKIIGVTGTKGKGTTSTLIYEMLKNDGKDAYLGGNIGLGVFDFLPKLKRDSWVVLELSSFQLIDLHKSPHIAVVLMITNEHQDWHVSEGEYLQAKMRIVKFQSENDFAIINDDYNNSKKVGSHGEGQKYYFSLRHKVEKGSYLKENKIITRLVKTQDFAPLQDINHIGLRGQHNLENIMAASLASKLAGVNEEIICEASYTFKSLEHRLEEVGIVDGVTYYNDSFSTVPETTIAAIKSFAEPLILIAGGSEKGSDFTEMGKTIVESPNLKAIILVGLMAARIEKSIQMAYNSESGTRRIKIVRGGKKMSEIMTAVSKIAEKGDVVLLSPGCASFDMFKNYKDRGNQFKEAVAELKIQKLA